MTPSLFRYSRSTACTALVVALVLILSPYFPGWSHRPGLWTYSMCWGVGFAVLPIAVYYFIYRVSAGDGRFTIRSFSMREFSLLDISNVEIKRSRGGAVAEVQLRNGDTLRISGELDGFATLVAALMLKRE